MRRGFHLEVRRVMTLQHKHPMTRHRHLNGAGTGSGLGGHEKGQDGHGATLWQEAGRGACSALVSLHN